MPHVLEPSPRQLLIHEIHVSPDGSGDGTRTAPASLERARDLVRERVAGMDRDIDVVLSDGRYRLGAPLVLTPGHSGLNGYRVCWRSETDGGAVLSGGTEVTGWSIHDAERNIWKAPVPAGARFEHLWFDNRRLVRAWSGWNPPGVRNTRRGVRWTDAGPDISAWRRPGDVVVTKRCMWRNIPATVHTVGSRELVLDPETVATYAVPTSALGVVEPIELYGVLNGLELRRADIALENAYELLTDEDEWHLDTVESLLYVKPRKDDEFRPDSRVTYSVLGSFIRLEGTAAHPVHDIVIQGLTFAYGDGSKLGVSAGSPAEPTSAVPPTPHAAVQVNRGERIKISSNTFMHLGADALHFDLGGRDLKVVGNGFRDISRAAISLNQTNLSVTAKNKRGVQPDNADKFFEDVVIANNYIRTTGVDDIGAAVVYSEFTRRLKVLHNEISDVPTYAIRGSWRFLAWRGHGGDIEYGWNKVSKVGRSGLKDFGGINISCSNVAPSSIHHNYVADVGTNPDNAAIYLDVHSEQVTVHHNVTEHIPRGRLLGGWLEIILSKHNEAYGNWTDGPHTIDAAPSHYRFWPSRTNRVHDNHVIAPGTPWPSDAQAVIDAAGLEPEFADVRRRAEARP
jgi:hypothetical protein